MLSGVNSNLHSEPYLEDPDVTIWNGDALTVLRELPDESVDCCVTSPPYWGLRDYGEEGQIGLERTPAEWIERLVELFREVRRVLRGRGTLWLNLGDTFNAYNGGAGPGSKLSKTQTEQRPRLASGYGLQDKSLKPKDLIGIPWRVALALQADGWWLRSDIVWSKPNPMPESISDRPTKSHEHVFLLTKSERYYFGQEDLRESYTSTRWGGRYHNAGPDEKYVNGDGRMAATAKVRKDRPQFDHYPNEAGRNVRDVWEIPTRSYPDAHFAVFPVELARRMILGGCPPGGTVLDPFGGSGTTALVARNLERKAVLIELNTDYCEMAARRLGQQSLLADVRPLSGVRDA
jgi:DNA modification methylase